MARQTELISKENLQRAAHLLLQEEIVAFPTETVYGLGACLFSEKAVRKIFQAKGRPSDNPLIVHISTLDTIDEIAVDIPDEFYTLAKNFFPGPLTLVIPRHPDVPSLISANLPTIAVRMPSHPTAKALIELVGQPLVAPSANLSGKPSATCVSHVLEDFEGIIPAVVLGESSQYGIESTVVSLLESQIQILRPGSITKQEIEKVLGRTVSVFNPSLGDRQVFPSPGMKYRHYAPKAKVLLFDQFEEVIGYAQKRGEIKKMFITNKKDIRIDLNACFELSSSNLYFHLRLSDQFNFEEIIVYCDEKVRDDLALMNRLLKCAGKI